MGAQRSVEIRLIQVLAVIAMMAIAGVLVLLPYRLYSRDIRHATVEAHRISNVLHAALSQAILAGEDTTSLVNRFQGIADLEIRLRALGSGEEHPAAVSGRGSSTLDGTDLTYVAPPILDREGRTWIAEMYFDLSPMKRESVQLIIDLVLAVVIGSMLFSVLVFWLVHVSLVVPLRHATEVIERHDPQTEIVQMPAFRSREMSELAGAVEAACRAHHGVG
jgi:hypothetical protein